MEVEYLRTFLAVLDEQGFAAAGRRLFVSAVTVTERIQRLERDLGARVLVRQPVSLTQAGSVLEPAARRIVSEVDGVVNAIAGLPSRLADVLSVGLMAGGAAELNAPIRRTMQRALPRCRVAWVELPLADTETAILDGRVDVAILRAPVEHPAVESVPLFRTHRVVLASGRGPFAGLPSMRVADLGDIPVTGISRNHGRAFSEFFRLGPDRNGEPAPVAYVDTFAESFHQVVTGHAVAVPSADATRLFTLPPGIVAVVPLVDATPSGPVGVCRRHDRRPVVRSFMRVLQDVAETCQGLVPDALPLLD